MLKFITKSICIYLLFLSYTYANIINVFEFTAEELETLDVRKVKKLTTYTLGSNNNGNFIKAEAKGVGSGLGKKIEIDLDKTPFINITWKVEKDLKGIKEKEKKGHDFAARVFVVKKTGLTALSNKAINYVFSSNQNEDDYWRSPYTKSSIDYVLSTTKKNFDEWVTVKANVKEHFKKLHDLDIDFLDGVAIMTDTDQSKIQAISYYQNIYFSSE
tara:strand:+ start:3730 stop:4374 length:645 start_codon:yes stop_codon:yes gene_type:complete